MKMGQRNLMKRLCWIGEIDMKIRLARASSILILALVLAVSGNTAFAGGRVDTSAARFANADFTNSQFITNPWWTLTAGENRLYFAESDDGCAWNLVEVLNGVDGTTDNFGGDYAGTEARIILDRGWVDEECEYDNFADVWANLPTDEATYDWYAQDTDKNIWYMGEDTLDGEGSSEGSFVAGCDGAEAGIVLLGDPAKGLFYQQEFYAGEAEDWGKVLNFVKLDGMDDMECLKTKEWTPLERGHIEHKFYCSDGTTGELTLIKELKGKTVVVELIAMNVAAPPAPVGPPYPIPADCED